MINLQTNTTKIWEVSINTHLVDIFYYSDPQNYSKVQKSLPLVSNRIPLPDTMNIQIIFIQRFPTPYTIEI